MQIDETASPLDGTSDATSWAELRVELSTLWPRLLSLIAEAAPTAADDLARVSVIVSLWPDQGAMHFEREVGREGGKSPRHNLLATVRYAFIEAAYYSMPDDEENFEKTHAELIEAWSDALRATLEIDAFGHGASLCGDALKLREYNDAETDTAFFLQPSN